MLSRTAKLYGILCLRRLSSSRAVILFPAISCGTTPASGPHKDKNLQLYQELVAKRLRVISLSEEKADGAKLSVRERLALLVDEGSEVLEIGLLSGLGLPYGDVPCAGNAVCIVEVCGENVL